MDFTFSAPMFGFLLLLVPLFWFLPRQPIPITHSVLRSVIVTLLILALMQPVVLSSESTKHFAVVLDQSNSLSAEQKGNVKSQADALIDNLSEDGDITLVQIGGETQPSAGVQHIRLPDNDKTSLTDALNVALQAIPLGVQGAVALFSDGESTDRHWGPSILNLQDRAIPVHTYHVDDQAQDLYPIAIEATSVRPGEEAEVVAEIQGVGTDVVVQLFESDTLLDERIYNTGGTFQPLTFKAPEKPFIDLSIRLVTDPSQDADPNNNSLTTTVAVQPALRVLYVHDLEGDAAFALQQLLGSGFAVEAIDPSQLAQIRFSRYDLVWLDDVSVDVLTEDIQKDLVDTVSNTGLGLLVSGGKRAYGDGGYAGELISSALPVKILGKQDNIDPSVGLAIILDTSGSMAGSRIELAKHIARIAVRRLQPHDRIGIVEFYGNKHWAVPMQPASTKIEIDRAIGRMKAIGGTVLYPAIQEAYYGLKNVNTRYKHIVLITDAGVEDSNYEAMLRQIAKDRINVSTILVGQGGHNLIMSNIANWGHGRFYAVGNQFQLVDLILKQPSLSTPPLFQQGEFQLKTKSFMGWLDDIELEDIPAISGYSETEYHPDTQLLVEVDQKNHPIVSTWQYGLGKVTAIPTEPLGESTAAWEHWSVYPEFIARIAALTSDNLPTYQIDLKRKNDTMHVTVHGSREVPIVFHFQDETANASTAQELPMEQTTPDRFESTLFIPNSEPFYLGVQDHAKQRWIYAVDPAASDHDLESQVSPSNGALLAGLPGITGGQTLTATGTLNSENLDVSPGELSFVVTKLWSWLLLLALLTYLGDLVYRRWPR